MAGAIPFLGKSEYKMALKATWPSGKARVCKTLIPGSIPGVASSFESALPLNVGLPRFVVPVAPQFVRQELLVPKRFRMLVRVLVALAEPLRTIQAGRGVAEVERHRLMERFPNILARRAVGVLGGIALRRQRQIERGLGERQHRLRHPDGVRRLVCRYRNRQRLRIRQADV